MQTINVSDARARLPELLNKVFAGSQSFLITKGGIPMAKIIKADKVGTIKKTKKTKKEIEKAINELAGAWKGRWKGMSANEVADMLADKAWNSHAS